MQGEQTLAPQLQICLERVSSQLHSHKHRRYDHGQQAKAEAGRASATPDDSDDHGELVLYARHRDRPWPESIR